MAEGTSTNPEDLVQALSYKHCRFFLLGRCRYGDECWNIHTANDSKANHIAHGAGPSHQRQSIQRTFPSQNKRHRRHIYPSSNTVHSSRFVPKGNHKKMQISKLCVYNFNGECPSKIRCPYIHGDLCNICQKHVLIPNDESQRKQHHEHCAKELEKDMELSFAVQCSKDKSCGICLDVVYDKEKHSDRRFGILEKCDHIYCIGCIRKWRSVNNSGDLDFKNETAHACPQCRIPSNFFVPSEYWYDSKEEKDKVISDFKAALGKKPCRYFKQGTGHCQFMGACFYLHALSDGTKIELPPPVARQWEERDSAVSERELDTSDSESSLYSFDYENYFPDDFLELFEDLFF